ncbi:3-methyl-2-oxobutanoate hydroxymethyltransferase [bacterium]|nr:3-methyl-2-oxobutanoate hydroxymethyltransferase [bacterium]
MAVEGRVTVPKFMAAKAQGRKLAVVTAYDWLWAGICDAAGVDAILVGDSLAMVVQGRSSTLPVTLSQMLYHAELVTRGVQRAMVIVDLPFLSYHVSPRQAVRNAGQILKRTEAAAVKLEGGVQQADTIKALADADIPVMAHVGLRPQSVRMLGSMGKIQRDRDLLLADAQAAEQAGAFGIVLEMVSQKIAADITQALTIPTIGIGAGPHCDGQVLVGQDLLGLMDGFHPKFLKKYADLRTTAIAAIQQYATEVRSGEYPTAAHSHD